MSANRRDILRGGAALALLGACGGTASKLAGPFRPAVRCAEDGCATVDVHCHVFNASDLPVAAFLSSVAPVPERLIRRLAEAFQRQLDRRAPPADEEHAALAAAFAGAPIRGGARPTAEATSSLLGVAAGLASPRTEEAAASLRRLVVLLDYILQSRARIAAAMIETYATVDLFTPCLVDFDFWAGGRTRSSLAAQIRVQERLSKLSIRGRLGRADARMHPFVAFNPLREVLNKIIGADTYRPYGDDRVFVDGARYDPAAAPLARPAGDWAARSCAPPEGGGGIELVRHAVETAGCIGVKMYPPVGFVPLRNAAFHPDPERGAELDRALRAFYAYAEAEQVPITAHSANSNGYRLGYGDLAAPKGWERVLVEFPRLRLNLGHFGHLAGVDDERGIAACEAWIREAGLLMQSYPNVYADMSYSEIPIEAGYADRYLDAVEKIFERFPCTPKRIMYGSDWWLNRLSANDALHVDAYHQVFQDRFGAAVRTDVMGGNALRFLGLLDDGGRPADTPSRRRLLAFYDAEPLPSWLAAPA
jgi:predicted TIM-barrel fold metal-dependent hydrolase